MWCVQCGIRVINEPISYIYCAVCPADYHNHLGMPVDWTALFDLGDIYVRFEDLRLDR
jgi:hypothetical protein